MRIAMLVLFSLLFATSAVGDVLVGGTDFTFSDWVTGGSLVTGDPADTANGLHVNTPHGNPGDGISYTFTSPFEIRYVFNVPENIVGSFFLYNGWDAEGQSINQFQLRFFDSASAQVGATFAGVGNFGVGDEVFPLGTNYPNVKSVVLRVDSVHAQHLEFREIAFETPEPTALLLAALGILLNCPSRVRK